MKLEHKISHLKPVPLCEADVVNIDNFPARLEFKIVTEADIWLETSYQMLVAQFSADLLDPYERYVRWLELNHQKKHPFPFLIVVAYIQDGEHARLVGVIEGNIMPVANYVKHAADGPSTLLMADGSHIYTIGHQMTSAVLRSQGIKGVGTNLWNEAIIHAKAWVSQRGGILRYSVLESEAASIGFWSKLGYCWPQGSRYWQPPLEFDDEGNRLFDEVEELLMLAPIDGVSGEQIDRELLLNIVATLYLNWSLDAYRSTLSEAAMHRAEEYVMTDLFGRLCDAMPQQDMLKLAQVNGEGEVAHP